jgi:hypothetical protein
MDVLPIQHALVARHPDHACHHREATTRDRRRRGRRDRNVAARILRVGITGRTSCEHRDRPSECDRARAEGHALATSGTALRLDAKRSRVDPCRQMSTSRRTRPRRPCRSAPACSRGGPQRVRLPPLARLRSRELEKHARNDLLRVPRLPETPCDGKVGLRAVEFASRSLQQRPMLPQLRGLRGHERLEGTPVDRDLHVRIERLRRQREGKGRQWSDRRAGSQEFVAHS